MPVANPYIINIQLFWPNGTRANQNEIARVNAFDVGGVGAPTPQGQSGYDSNTGGWQQLVLQNTAAFSSQRDFANLRFDVVNTQEQRVHVTQVFQSIKSGSTVKIVIGQSDSLIGQWRVQGVVRDAVGAELTEGSVKVYDVTAGSTLEIGTAVLSGGGAYSVNFEATAFETNGVPHSRPNLVVKYLDVDGMVLAQSPLSENAGQTTIIDLTVGNVEQSGDYRVFGYTQNELGLRVADVLVEAYNLVWTKDGVREKFLGKAMSDATGAYDISYSPETETEELANCSVSQGVALVVYAKSGTIAQPGSIITQGPTISPAKTEERVDLLVDLVSAVETSEYAKLHAKLWDCLGSDDQKAWATLNQLAEREDHRKFIADSLGVSVDLVTAYVSAWRISGRINNAITWDGSVDGFPDYAPGTFQDFDPQVIYGLLRIGPGSTFEELLELPPADFYNAIVAAIERYLIDAEIEQRLSTEATYPLQEQWKMVVAFYLGGESSTSTWQSKLLSLALPSEQALRQMIAAQRYDFEGSFDDYLQSLVVSNDLTELQAEDVLFVFELYEAVDQYFQIVEEVFSQKEANGWEVVADLSTVPLNPPSGGGVSWAKLAEDQSNRYPGGFPGDVVGKSKAEKTMVYAARLYDQFGARSPEVRYAQDAVVAGDVGNDDDLKNVGTFLQNNENFDLTKTPVDKYLSDNSGDPAAQLTPSEVEKLKQLQRVARLSPKFEVGQALVALGFDSAVQIARIAEDEFIAEHEQALGGLTNARAVHRKAKLYASEVFSKMVKFNRSLNDVGGSTAFSAAVSTPHLEEVGSESGKFPNWVSLFGGLNSCASKHCQTVLSPGAYLADLLQWVDGSPKRLLFERRPDIENIELTCPNTERAVPYIDLAIEALEAVIAPHEVPPKPADAPRPDGPFSKALLDEAIDDDEQLQVLRTIFFDAGYLLTDRAVVKISALDKRGSTAPYGYQEWIVEDDGWRFTLPLAAGGVDGDIIAYGAPQTSERADSPEVFPEHANPRANEILGSARFPLQLPLSLGREEVELLVEQRGSTRAAVREVFRRGRTPIAPSLSRDEVLNDPEHARTYLGLTANEEQAVLWSGPDAHEHWGFEEVTDFEIPRPESPSILIKIQSARDEDWTYAMAEMSVFMHRTGLKYDEVRDLLDAEYVQGNQVPKIEIHADDEAALECNYNRFRIFGLDENALLRISFFLRLRRVLGWDMRTLDRYLMTIERVEFSEVDALGIPQDLVRVAQVHRFAAEQRIDLPLGFMLWGNLDTRRTERYPRSYFDDVYLRGSSGSADFAALELLARGGPPLSILEDGTVVDSLASVAGLKGLIRAALRLSTLEVDALWGWIVGSPGTFDLAALTHLGRIALYARATGVGILDYLVFFDLGSSEGLLGLPGVPAPRPLGQDLAPDMLIPFRSVEELARLEKTGASAMALDYLLRHRQRDGQLIGPTVDELEELDRQLTTSAKGVFERYPLQENPDTSVVGRMLGEVMPELQVPLAMAWIRTLPAVEEQAAATAFYNRYFAVFASYGPGLSIEGLVEGGSGYATEDERLQRIYENLRPYLVEQARVEAALAVGTTATGANRALVERLLKEDLSRLSDANASALMDWQLGVGGWSSGAETLTDVVGTHSARYVVPADGAYEFVLSVDGTGVNVGDYVLTGAGPSTGNSVVDGRTRIGFSLGLEPLKANEVLNLQVTIAVGGLPTTLLVRRDNGDPQPIPAYVVTSFAHGAMIKLHKALLFKEEMALTDSELNYLTRTVESPLLDQFPTESGTSVPWVGVEWFVDQLSLNRTVKFSRSTLFDEWTLSKFPPKTTQPGEAPYVFDRERVIALTGWSRSDLDALLDTVDGVFNGSTTDPENPPDPPSLLAPETWFVIAPIFDLLPRLGISAEETLELLVVPANPESREAVVLRDTLRANYSADEWKKIFKPLRDRLRRTHRDALLGYMTSKPVEVAGEEVSFFDANDIYAFFLIDPEMEPDTLISRVKLALNSIQLMVQRVFLGLETRQALTQLDRKKSEWVWMKNYRVWEANRKVFLYPENWIEPELRDDKTELFRTLEEELFQEEVTHERALTTLSNYIEGLDELGNLVVVAACTEGVFSQGRTSVVHIVARTRATPYTYYHRRFEGRQFVDGIFSDWKKIGLEIDHPTVAPVVVNGSLHLFWPLIQEKEKPTRNEESMGSFVEIRFLWSSLVPETGAWTKAKVGKEKIVDNEIVNAFDRDARDDGPQTNVYQFKTAEERGTAIVAVYKAKYFGWEVKLLGQLRLTPQGEEKLGGSQVATPTFGVNHPLPSVLEWNSTWSSATEMGFFFSKPFFRKVEFTRALVTNLGNIGDAQNQPFFVETTRDSFMALHQKTAEQVDTSKSLVQTASFFTFGYPVLPDIKKRYRASGPIGIMDRRTQALPTSDGRYYYNLSANALSSTAGSYTSGYSNRYNYYGGIYLGYHIAGDKMAMGVAQRDFEVQYQPGPDTVKRPYPLPTVEFKYGAPFGEYNWELFFHLPLLIADRLTQEMRFEEAMNWYHFIFDPRGDLNSYEKSRRFVSALPDGARYWNFLPFFANRDATDSLTDSLGVTENLNSYEKQSLSTVIQEWRRNPFNPHLIARQRIVAYQKATVMKYLDNLIAWGDQLFRRDTFESINEATQLYVLAAEILGKRPEIIAPVTSEPRYTYRELKALGIDQFANTFIEVENLMVANSEDVEGEELDPENDDLKRVQSVALQSLYFRIPRNEHLDKYWDTVQDRLFKIRNSMNIDGIKRSLALFEPPIDPALLVKAAAAGVDLSTAIGQLGRPMPHYRFRVWNQKAMDLANEVKAFGGALLAALEKKDAEELAQLRQDHEIRILRLALDVRKDQVTEAEENIAGLEASRALAEDRRDTYGARAFINPSEASAFTLTGRAGDLEVQAGVMNTIGSALAPIPQIEIGLLPKAQFGGLHLSQLFAAIASGMSTGATNLRSQAGQASTLAGYMRRKEDWDLQKRQAELEIEQINQQIVSAQIRLEIAQKEVSNHEVQIEQSEEVQTFLEEKFTTKDLYKWMTTELGRTYRQVYNLAFDVAKTAERTYQFELGKEETDFIQFGYMEGRYKGLLAGEKLTYDLKRMDIAYLEHDKREFEITKPISLMQLNPGALESLREQGWCEFEIPEVIFDLDHPGQYFRRIQAVRVTIPCVTGPYTSVTAKLSLLSSAIRTQGSSGGSYAYTGFEDRRFAHRVGNIQSIATSSAQDDSGLFELNFNDERYLPFEGSGVIGRWRLELPTAARQFDYHSISDVIMNMSYTARDAGGTLKLAAEGEITAALNNMLSMVAKERASIERVFSLKREFPDGLHQLLASAGDDPDSIGRTTLTIRPEHFPYLLRQQEFALSPGTKLDEQGQEVQEKLNVRVVLRNGAASGSFGFHLGEAAPTGLTGLEDGDADLIKTVSLLRSPLPEPILPGWVPETWNLSQQGLSPSDVDDVLIIIKYTLA